MPPRFKLGTAEPKAAFEAFAERELLQPTFNWWDVYQQEHASAFMVAGIHEQQLLQVIRDLVGGTLRSGGSFKDFAKALKPTLVAKGWWGDVAITDPKTGEQRITRFDDARLRLILDTNLRQSNAAGRWRAAERGRDRRPFLLYRTMRDERVRISHQAWEGVALPIDHPWWDTHFPPNGWRCRCRAIAVSERDLQRYRDDGVKIITEPPAGGTVQYLDRRTGQTAEVPAGIDPGFAYNAGKARIGELGKLARRAERPPVEPPPPPPSRLFYPQASAKAAGKWAVENDLVDRADYAGVKPEVANAWNRSLFEHLQQFPELRRNQRFAGTAQAQLALHRAEQIEKALQQLRVIYPGQDEATLQRWAERRVPIRRMQPEVWAHSVSSGSVSGVAVNRKWGAAAEAWKASLTRNVQNGYHPPGADTIKSVIDHELGHQLDTLLNLRNDAGVLALHAEARLAGMRQQVSGYAEKNIAEFIAEAWSEYLNNPTPRETARRLADIVKARYAARFRAP